MSEIPVPIYANYERVIDSVTDKPLRSAYPTGVAGAGGSWNLSCLHLDQRIEFSHCNVFEHMQS